MLQHMKEKGIRTIQVRGTLKVSIHMLALTQQTEVISMTLSKIYRRTNIDIMVQAIHDHIDARHCGRFAGIIGAVLQRKYLAAALLAKITCALNAVLGYTTHTEETLTFLSSRLGMLATSPGPRHVTYPKYSINRLV